MKKYNLLRSGDSIIRVLEVQGDRVLVIDCIKRTMTSYTMMLKEKYCDSLGILAEEYPSFYQFRYFYRKTKNLQDFFISRDGLKNYQRNNRPLTGEGVQEFAPAVGTGMFDATVCDRGPRSGVSLWLPD